MLRLARGLQGAPRRRCSFEQSPISNLMHLTLEQANRRRFVLMLMAAMSVVALALGVAAPSWQADAGGLENGERAKHRGRKTSTEPANRIGPEAGTRRAPPPLRSIPTGTPTAQSQPPAPAPKAGPTPSVGPSWPRPTAPAPQTLPPGLQPQPLPLGPGPQTETTGLPLETLKSLFRRPQVSTRDTPAEIELGARLFQETKLSADHKMSCATCHDPERSFNDGRIRARSNTGKALSRNTPSIWNVADAKAFYWDARVATLSAQVKDAIERDGEMDATLEAAVVWLARDPTYVAAFGRTFGTARSLSIETIVQALTSYQRSLISPVTRFDRWVDGDAGAISEREIIGFRLFAGRGRCLACHGGWRFTDDKVHDIGLRSNDRGQGALPGSSNTTRAFKTPSLREAVWSGPYMHDGSKPSLEQVVAHYAGGLEKRASLAPELKPGIVLTERERGDLVAFLQTLSSPQMPRAR
jgi:cytochrome c peroxidase